MSTLSNRLRVLRREPDESLNELIREAYSYISDDYAGIWVKLVVPSAHGLGFRRYYFDVISTTLELVLCVHEYNRRKK